MVITWKRRLVRVLLDLGAALLIAVLVAATYACERRGYVKHRGFFCDDPSIRYPFKVGTVPTWALVISSLGIPMLAMLVGIVIEFCSRQRVEAEPGLRLCSSKIVIPPWALRLGYNVQWFLIGLGVTVIITDIGKLVVGRLRPHFIAVCDPDFSVLNCTDTWGNPLYVTDYTCRADNDMVNAARLSWPSGHSSISAYAFVFTAFYVSTVRVFYHRNALKLLLMLVSILLAFLTALSRISDYDHHPLDILSGMIIGSGVAVAVVYYHLYYFNEHRHGDAEEKCLLGSDEADNVRLKQPAGEPQH